MSAPPYESDVRSRGWRFELDLERIHSSDTWALAAPAVRPWLLMLWAVAWEQRPAGSLPDDHALIAAHLGMPLDDFEPHRAVLLRGWAVADDGRLYHPVLVERVREMLAARDRERTRKAEYRARKSVPAAPVSSEVPALSHGTDGGVSRESATRTGTGSSLNPPQTPPPSGGGGEGTGGETKRQRRQRVSLQTFIDRCIEVGERPISGHEPLLRYVEQTGLPMEFVQLAWQEFKGEFLPGGSKAAQLQADWRAHFLNFVRKNYLRLWWAKPDGTYELTTTGLQASRVHKEAS